MFKRVAALLIVLTVLVGSLVGCGGGGEASGGGGGGEAALKITGEVNTEASWTEAELKGMDTIEAEHTNKEGEMETYTGVPINTLLGEAGVKDGATTITFVADDGYTADVTWEELEACADCIIAFRNQGGLRTVMPEFSGKLQVKGVIEIQVK